MLVKIVMVFCITKYVHGQLNGQFWWMNEKIAKYHNTLIPPPRIEEIPEYETDDTVKITFRDSEFDQYHNKFRDRRQNFKFNNHNVPHRDLIRYPGETIYPDYKPSRTPSNLIFASKPSDNDRQFLANERINENKSVNYFNSESLKVKDNRQGITTQTPEKSTTTKQITPVSISTLETRAPFASFNDYMNFINDEKTQENAQTDDLCTYIKQTECERRKGLVYNLKIDRNHNGNPNDPNLVCCTFIPKTEIVSPTTKPIKQQQEETVQTTDPIKVTAEKNNLNLEEHDDSNSENKNNDKSPNFDAQIQSICKYITEEECHSNNGFVNYVISKKYPKRNNNNQQLVCCILLPKSNIIDSTSKTTTFLQDKDTKSTSRNEFSERVFPQLDIDDYISKFGVIKNTSSSNLQLQNNENKAHGPNNSTTSVPKNITKQPQKAPTELNKIIPGFKDVDDYVSKFGVINNKNSGIQGHRDTNIIQNTKRPTVSSLNLIDIDNYISKFGVVKNTNNNSQLQNHGDTHQKSNTTSVAFQENNQPKTTKPQNQSQTLSSIDIENFISKFSVVKNTTSFNQPEINKTKTISNTVRPTVFVENNITDSFDSKNIDNESGQKVRTTAIPFKFPEKVSYMATYNNDLSVNESHTSAHTLNASLLHDHKSIKSLLLEVNIEDLISKYGVNTDKEQVVANKTDWRNNSSNNLIAFKAIETTTVPNNNMKNCTFIKKYKCFNLKGTIYKYSINDLVANDQQTICCILPLQIETYTEQTTKVNKEIKVLNPSKGSEHYEANIFIFPTNNLLKYPQTSTEKPFTFPNNFNKPNPIVPTTVSYNNANDKSDKTESENSNSICKYIKEPECKKRKGFVYGIQFGKSMTKGPRDPELVCCILLENEDNNDQVKAVSRTNEQATSQVTKEAFSDLNTQTTPLTLQSNFQTYDNSNILPFVFPSEIKKNDSTTLNDNNTKFQDQSQSSISNFMNNDFKIRNTESPFVEKDKKTNDYMFFPDEDNYRYKRSNDDGVSTALKQRTVLLQRRFTTQAPKLGTTHIKLATPDYDDDPYWNVKNLKFHSHQTTNKKKCDYESKDYYVDEIPQPGLKGLYSDHGSRPSYDTDYKYNDYDDSDYEDSGISFGYSTIDPRLDSSKRKVKLQTKPPQSSAKGPERYDPEKQIVNFQSNPDFHVFENFKLLNVARRKTKFSLNANENYDKDSVLTKPIPESSEEYDEDFQLYKDCGRKKIRNNFLATKQIGDAQFGSHPWLALVVPTHQQQKMLCYATLIHPKAAITTADCVYEKAPGEVTLIAGIWDLNQRSRARTRIPTVHIHTEYTNDDLDNDLAILSWTQPLKLSTNIQPACLSDMKSGEDCMTFGWNGFEQTIRSRSKWQRVTTSDCDNMQDFSEQEIPNTAFCGKVQSRGAVSSKGGPLICTIDGRQSLVGIVVSQQTNLLLLPARSWGLKADNFMNEE